MKFALIAYPGDLEYIDFFRLSYHLVLAQYAMRDREYMAFYADRSQRGDFIILDNGAAEGELASFDAVLTIANDVGADEIVLPDVLGDGRETLRLTSHQVYKVPERNRMVVPQGRDWNEWQWCLKSMVQNWPCRSIGVAKRYEGYDGGRVRALRYIRELGYDKHIDVHLLGCYDNPIREVRDALIAMPWVRGIDTAAPLAYAQMNLAMSGGKHASYEWGKIAPAAQATMNIRTLLDVVAGL